MAEALPGTGLTEIDRLILRAAELGLRFPPLVTRWQLIAWAAEALQAQRQDPQAFARGGLREITKRAFPTANT